MDRFLAWLAGSPIASAVKVASGAVLVWLVANVTTFDFPAWVQVAVIAGVPVLINWLNPQDPRYGVVSVPVGE